jgi:hypothetical protein
MARPILSLFFLFFTLASCKDVFILYPSRGESAKPTFSIGDTLNVTWQNSSDNPKLILWCSAPNDDQLPLFRISGQGLKASDSYLILLANSSDALSDRCHLELKPPGVNSVNFAIIADQEGSVATTWGLDSPTQASSSSRTTAGRTSSSATGSTASPTAFSTEASTAGATPSALSLTNSTSSGLAIGAKIGIGLGVGLAVIICTTAIAFLMRRRRKAGIEAESMLSPKQADYGQSPKPELAGCNVHPENQPSGTSNGAVLAELPETSKVTRTEML